MPSATITSKGQVTIPKKIRDKLNLRAGDSVNFELEPGGRAVLIPSKHKPEVLYGILERKEGQSRASQKMKDDVAEYFKEKYKNP
ncbi:MAG: AbrB/MazE/SpoVT family DNA-binding domain-containing protein [Bacteroidetes bacterium]|jgi:AbrB family looped-hinge helix DNA binding protein|nr:AbrB/MazE/SpoVT family DNA-binding domain-containing protein [Bacteroidota bacterium]